MLEPSWAKVGSGSKQVGPKLGPSWPKLAPSGAHVAAMSDRNGELGLCCADMQDVQSSTVSCTFKLKRCQLNRLSTRTDRLPS